MAVDIKSPEIAALREAVEQKLGFKVLTPRHFTALAEAVENELREYLSETTLQRLWEYKKGYDSVALHTLNVLSRYCGYTEWTSFCSHIKAESQVESELFTGDSLDIGKLKSGTKIKIAWRPDRVCIIEYLGNFRFCAIETHNSKLAAGDTFTCHHIQLGREMHLDDLVRGGGDMSYVIGTRNGITRLTVMG